MKRITFNLHDPIAERWLADACAHGQQQTEVITTALRQAASEAQGRSLREQALQEEIERLHQLITRIAATGRADAPLTDKQARNGGLPPTDTWTWEA